MQQQLRDPLLPTTEIKIRPKRECLSNDYPKQCHPMLRGRVSNDEYCEIIDKINSYKINPTLLFLLTIVFSISFFISFIVLRTILIPGLVVLGVSVIILVILIILHCIEGKYARKVLNELNGQYSTRGIHFSYTTERKIVFLLIKIYGNFDAELNHLPSQLKQQNQTAIETDSYQDNNFQNHNNNPNNNLNNYPQFYNNNNMYPTINNYTNTNNYPLPYNNYNNYYNQNDYYFDPTWTQLQPPTDSPNNDFK